MENVCNPFENSAPKEKNAVEMSPEMINKEIKRLEDLKEFSAAHSPDDAKEYEAEIERLKGLLN